MPISNRAWRKISPFELSKGFRNDLSSLMLQAGSASSIGEKVEWMESLVDWIRLSPSADAKGSAGELRSVRIRFLLQSLDKNEAWKKNISRMFRSLILETEIIPLLCETGLNSEEGFLSETFERILQSIVPSPQDNRDLAELFSRIFDEDSDPEWLENIDGELARSLSQIIFSDPDTDSKIREKFSVSLSEAILIICAHLQSLGLQAEIRKRTYIKSANSSAFSKLHFHLLDSIKRGQLDFQQFTQLEEDCRNEILSGFAHLEEHGVSVSIVYRLERMEKFLHRLRLLVATYFSDSSNDKVVLKLLANLISSNLERKSLRAFLKHNLHMLSRKIVERTGISGEHYITQSAKEFWQMFFSALGGGVVTAFTTLAKFVVTKSNPALFFEGLFSWINYSGSFLFMQACHFTLATKQPSMTASSLASHLKEGSSPEDFSLLVARIFRSQFISAVGNIGAVIPIALLISFIQVHAFNGEILSVDAARKTIASLDPTRSLTIFYGALTGIVLWLSSIGAGWTENWFVLRRIPETLSQSPFLKRVFGKRAEKVARWINKNVSGIGGNLCLGFLLAFIPVAGSFFGLPLEVRHVTLSAGSLTYAFYAVPSPTAAELAMGAFSVFCIGLLNFGVSFAAALFVAIRAREVRAKRLHLFRRNLLLFARKRWWLFFYPSKNTRISSN